MSVRAKFRVTCIESRGTGANAHKTFVLNPVTSGSEENKSFFKWTPSGEIRLATVNPEVQLDLEGEYYVDFTKAG